MDVSTIITIASLIAAILAWIAKLRWSDEYSKAKDAQLAAKQAEIAVLEREVSSLKELSPAKVKEYFFWQLNSLKNIMTSLKNSFCRPD